MLGIIFPNGNVAEGKRVAEDGNENWDGYAAAGKCAADDGNQNLIDGIGPLRAERPHGCAARRLTPDTVCFCARLDEPQPQGLCASAESLAEHRKLDCLHSMREDAWTSLPVLSQASIP